MRRWSSRSALGLLLVLGSASRAPAQGPDALLMRLGAMSAVTGLEDAMADSILALLPGSRADRAGNVILVRGSGTPTRVAACPMDEVGYVVGNVTAEGYLTLRRVGNAPVGPLYDQFLEGHRVTVFGRRGPVPGVVGVRSTHLARGRPQGADEAFRLDEAYVDVGAASAAEVAALGIELLVPVTRAKRVHRYGERGALAAAPWMAQRAACAALLAAAGRAGRGRGRGTAVYAFLRRGHFGNDGAWRLLADHPGAEVVLLGGVTSAAPGSGPATGGDSVAGRSVSLWSLPARHHRTPVETVSLADVAALEQRLVAWLEGR